MIGYGGDPYRLLEPDARAWLAARAAVVLAIVAPGHPASAGTDCPVLEDLDGVLRVPRRPAVTIVRPDRFLLGTLPGPLTAAHLAVR